MTDDLSKLRIHASVLKPKRESKEGRFFRRILRNAETKVLCFRASLIRWLSFLRLMFASLVPCKCRRKILLRRNLPGKLKVPVDPSRVQGCGAQNFADQRKPKTKITSAAFFCQSSNRHLESLITQTSLLPLLPCNLSFIDHCLLLLACRNCDCTWYRVRPMSPTIAVGASASKIQKESTTARLTGAGSRTPPLIYNATRS
jgi:hypothetical protein